MRYETLGYTNWHAINVRSVKSQQVPLRECMSHFFRRVPRGIHNVVASWAKPPGKKFDARTNDELPATLGLEFGDVVDADNGSSEILVLPPMEEQSPASKKRQFLPSVTKSNGKLSIVTVAVGHKVDS